MHLIFVDESGYDKKWKKKVKKQQFYVLSAVIVPAAKYVEYEQQFFDSLIGAGVEPAYVRSLGYGEEIKAKDVASGSNFFKDDALRNSVREAFLSFPIDKDIEVVLVVIDKARHLDRYGERAHSPYELGTKFLMDRFKAFLEVKDGTGVCIFDHNPHESSDLMSLMSSLILKGNVVEYYSSFYGDIIERTNEFKRIAEFSFSDSKFSYGLQIADFFASMAYQYHKANRPGDCGWWDTLYSSLYKHGRLKPDGYGYKVFPKIQP